MILFNNVAPRAVIVSAVEIELIVVFADVPVDVGGVVDVDVTVLTIVVLPLLWLAMFCILHLIYCLLVKSLLPLVT